MRDREKTDKIRLAMELALGPFRIVGENPTPVLAAIQKWAAAEGRSFAYWSAQIVQVILDESLMDQPALLPYPNATVILSLESIELVRLANGHGGNIRWFCERDPRELVGPMLDHYRGTYYRKHLNQLIYSSDSDLEFYDLPQGTEFDASLLAAVCAAREAGINPNTIQKNLDQTFEGLKTRQSKQAGTISAMSPL